MAKYSAGDEIYIVEESEIIKAKILSVLPNNNYLIDTSDESVALFLRDLDEKSYMEAVMYEDHSPGSELMMSTALEDDDGYWNEVHEQYIFSSYEEAKAHTW